MNRGLPDGGALRIAGSSADPDLRHRILRRRGIKIVRNGAGDHKTEMMRTALKIILWVAVIGFGCNFVMQTISYSFYKRAKKMTDPAVVPEPVRIADGLTGYGHNLHAGADKVILFFGGSNYIAYNAVGKYAGGFDCPFLSVDYCGTQDSKGKMNLKTMQQSSAALYDWARKRYPDAEIICMGHSYGAGMAAYLASARPCKALILAAGYRDLSDLYNRVIPIFWGPMKAFISNNIRTAEYAGGATGAVYIIGSKADRTLGASLQKKLAACFKNAQLKIFDSVTHENYFVSQEVVSYVNDVIR
ncbi:MAG: CocE/NonD family hydrolase [Oscillospiraceae bacterium]|nr:CocE/NonD family hydrolase [Oscillospiraceae bacterium]